MIKCTWFTSLIVQIKLQIAQSRKKNPEKVYIPNSSDKTGVVPRFFCCCSWFTSLIVQIKLKLDEMLKAAMKVYIPNSSDKTSKERRKNSQV